MQEKNIQDLVTLKKENKRNKRKIKGLEKKTNICENQLLLAQEETKKLKEKEIVSEYKMLMANEENKHLRNELSILREENVKLKDDLLHHDICYHT